MCGRAGGMRGENGKSVRRQTAKGLDCQALNVRPQAFIKYLLLSLSPAVQVLLINLMPSLPALVTPTTHQLLTFPVCLLAFHKHLLSTYCLPSPA